MQFIKINKQGWQPLVLNWNILVNIKTWFNKSFVIVSKCPKNHKSRNQVDMMIIRWINHFVWISYFDYEVMKIFKFSE